MLLKTTSFTRHYHTLSYTLDGVTVHACREHCNLFTITCEWKYGLVVRAQAYLLVLGFGGCGEDRSMFILN